MSLSERARRASRATPSDHPLRLAGGIAGFTAIALGLQYGLIWAAVAGALLVGHLLNRDPDRYYLEGYTDGAQAGELLALEERRSDGLREGVRAQPEQPDGLATAGAPDPDQLAAAAEEQAIRRRALGQAAGRVPTPRTLTEDGNPAHPPANGPRPAADSFPIPAAQPAGLVGLEQPNGKEARGEVGFDVSQGSRS